MDADPRINRILDRFHPHISGWFLNRFEKPTETQFIGWNAVSKGHHLLLTAPTGSGKTLAAFLWAINRFAVGDLETGHTSVLYVSPLKALNNDIRRNLSEPLQGIRDAFQRGNDTFPEIRVMTRSGDTPQNRRRYMLRHPPEILITTPESLNLLLGTRPGIAMLSRLSTVILDEIHAVVGKKRGTHLITAVERLAMAGEFQRIALSATVKPVKTVAAFVGGYRLKPGPRGTVYTARDVQIIKARDRRAYELDIRYPRTETADSGNMWTAMAGEFVDLINRHHGVLIFTQSRRLAEKITYLINQRYLSEGHGGRIAYAHHGSLSREIRLAVEKQFKAGELKAIVATSSLELGIDIGHLDLVVLVQTPFSVASAMQRVGRGGHRVGEKSKGIFYPSHALDILSSAVMLEAVDNRALEPVTPPMQPLDVLAQVILSMGATRAWPIEALFQQIRTAYPYQRLGRPQFDAVIDMLAGRYAETRIRALSPRLVRDRVRQTVETKKGARIDLFLSGGTIPDRGYYQLRHRQTNARIGELDEEFVWEAKKGQHFTFGTQNWRVDDITHNDVFATPAASARLAPPFWRAESVNRSFHLSDKIGRFLEQADLRLTESEFESELVSKKRLTEAAANTLATLLKRQKAATRRPLPHRHHILIEITSTGPGQSPGHQVVVHNFWGGRINRPYALALGAVWKDRFHREIEVHAGDDLIALVLPEPVDPETLTGLVQPEQVRRLIRKGLESSGMFGARFRECAGRALLLPKRKFTRRMPLWMSRLKAQKLMDAVAGYPDFPIMLEAWRTCLSDYFDLDGLRMLLTEVADGKIAWSSTKTATPSPMAMGVSREQINDYMYREDKGLSSGTSKLSGDMINALATDESWRPKVPLEVIETFGGKRRRTFPGYAPINTMDLLSWIQERLWIPESEWTDLMKAVDRDGFDKVSTETGREPLSRILVNELADRIVRVSVPGEKFAWIAALENLGRITRYLPGQARLDTRFDVMDLSGNTISMEIPVASKPLFSDVLGEWLSFYGPISTATLAEYTGFSEHHVREAIRDLEEAGHVILGNLVEGKSGTYICDRENLEILLRMARRERTPVIPVRPLAELPLFHAAHHQIPTHHAETGGLVDALERLTGFVLPAAAWESDIFPARFSEYDPRFLDSAMQAAPLLWIGEGEGKISFWFEPDLDVRLPSEGDSNEPPDTMADLFPDILARYDFQGLVTKTGLSPDVLSNRLWAGVWRGRLTNTGFSALRTGILHRYQLVNAVSGTGSFRSGKRRGPGRQRFSRWKNARPHEGFWRRLETTVSEENPDLLEIAEKVRERARMLFDRYGILFRERLFRESSGFRWADVFPALRLMELAGEIFSGAFFEDIPGPQFVSRPMLSRLQKDSPDHGVFWLNAQDPLSLCGMPLEALKGRLPKRATGAFLVYHGSALKAVVTGFGKQVRFEFPPDDPEAGEYLAVFRHLAYRRKPAGRHVKMESINDVFAADSEYISLFSVDFDPVAEDDGVILYKKLTREI